jgi:hypothetical protein
MKFGEEQWVGEWTGRLREERICEQVDCVGPSCDDLCYQVCLCGSAWASTTL